MSPDTQTAFEQALDRLRAFVRDLQTTCAVLEPSPGKLEELRWRFPLVVDDYLLMLEKLKAEGGSP